MRELSDWEFKTTTINMLGLPGGAAVKNPPAMQEIQETPVQSLGLENPLEKKMATHSSILAWRIPWTEKPGGLQSIGWQRVTTEQVHTHMIKMLRSLLDKIDTRQQQMGNVNRNKNPKGKKKV